MQQFGGREQQQHLPGGSRACTGRCCDERNTSRWPSPVNQTPEHKRKKGKKRCCLRGGGVLAPRAPGAPFAVSGPETYRLHRLVQFTVRGTTCFRLGQGAEDPPAAINQKMPAPAKPNSTVGG